jgi:hypothetical protein
MGRYVTNGAAVFGIALSLLLSAHQFAHAQNAPASASPTPQRPTSEDFAAIAEARIVAIKLDSDARIAAMKAGLKIRPDQEKSWATFESTMRDLAKQRQDRLQQLSAQNAAATGAQAPDAIVLLRRRADAMAQTSADLKRFADAFEPLYKSLDDGQKRRMAMLVTPTGPR